MAVAHNRYVPMDTIIQPVLRSDDKGEEEIMNDLIRKEDAIKWFEPYADRGLKIPIETVIRNLEDIPAVEPKILEDGTLVVKVKDGSKIGRVLVEGENHFGGLYYLDDDTKQGEWIYCEDDEGQDGYKCSECGLFVPWYYGYEDINYIYKYHACPSCLARMKGADDEYDKMEREDE